jgi:hypothetical protein
MMYQTFHRQPIVEGHNARKLGTALRDYLELADLPRQHRQLAEHRVRYIVLHKDWLAEHRSRDPLPSVPAYRAEYPAVYEDGTTLLLQVY